MPYIDYMAGRNSGQYVASNPSRYRRNQRDILSNRSNQSNFGSGTVADAGASFQTDNSSQEPSLPRKFQESKPKLEELKMLLDRYASPEKARKTLEWAKIGLSQGDEKFLNQALHQFRGLAKSEGWRRF